VVDAVPVLHHQFHHLTKHVIGQEVRLQAEFQQPCVRGVIVMLLGLHAGVFQVLHFHIEIELVSHPLNALSQLVYREGLRKLIENPKLPLLGGLFQGKPSAIEGVFDGEVPPDLVPLSFKIRIFTVKLLRFFAPLALVHVGSGLRR